MTLFFFIGLVYGAFLGTGNEAVPQFALQMDPGFELNSLRQAEVERAVISFTKVGDSIYFLVRDSRNSASTISRVKLKSNPAGEGISEWHSDVNPIPGYSSSLAFVDNYVAYASHGDRANYDENYITFWAPEEANAKRVFIGQTKVRE